jgi:hypothetical protein
MNTKCRNCKKKKITPLFSLGNLSFTGKFANSKKENIPKGEVTLVKCNSCHLVQLSRNFSPKFLYGKDYGYRTGLNSTMTNHVKSVALEGAKISNLKSNDLVLDIASNDGTLLNFYPKNVVKVGIDPIIKKFPHYYKNINFKISNFFSYENIKKKKINGKFKVISALSVFYDLNDPNKFIKDVRKLLDKNGIFILEYADLLSIIKNCLFDTICHEHLEYYSSKIIINMMKKNGLKVFDLVRNNINGGSIRYHISHANSNHKINEKKLNTILQEEKKYKLESITTYKNFEKKIKRLKIKLSNFIKSNKIKGKTFHCYGASTKGNVLLQYFDISNNQIDCVADRNPLKYGKYTPGTKIKIVSEKESRAKKPSYYLVLPWHFKNEIIEREKKTMKQGSKFIFPLPKFSIR